MSSTLLHSPHRQTKQTVKEEQLLDEKSPVTPPQRIHEISNRKPSKNERKDKMEDLKYQFQDQADQIKQPTQSSFAADSVSDMASRASGGSTSQLSQATSSEPQLRQTKDQTNRKGNKSLEKSKQQQQTLKQPAVKVAEPLVSKKGHQPQLSDPASAQGQQLPMDTKHVKQQADVKGKEVSNEAQHNAKHLYKNEQQKGQFSVKTPAGEQISVMPSQQAAELDPSTAPRASTKEDWSEISPVIRDRIQTIDDNFTSKLISSQNDHQQLKEQQLNHQPANKLEALALKSSDTIQQASDKANQKTKKQNKQNDAIELGRNQLRDLNNRSKDMEVVDQEETGRQTLRSDKHVTSANTASMGDVATAMAHDAVDVGAAALGTAVATTKPYVDKGLQWAKTDGKDSLVAAGYATAKKISEVKDSVLESISTPSSDETLEKVKNEANHIQSKAKENLGLDDEGLKSKRTLKDSAASKVTEWKDNAAAKSSKIKSAVKNEASQLASTANSQSKHDTEMEVERMEAEGGAQIAHNAAQTANKETNSMREDQRPIKGTADPGVQKEINQNPSTIESLKVKGQHLKDKVTSGMSDAASSASGWVHEKEIQARKVLTTRQQKAASGAYDGQWDGKELDAQYGVSNKVSHLIDADQIKAANILAPTTEKGKQLEKQREFNDDAHRDLSKEKNQSLKARETDNEKSSIKEQDIIIEPAAPLDSSDAGSTKTDAFDDARDTNGNAYMSHNSSGMFAGLISGIANKLGLSPQPETRTLDKNATPPVRDDEAEWVRQSRMLKDSQPQSISSSVPTKQFKPETNKDQTVSLVSTTDVKETSDQLATLYNNDNFTFF